ncbi:MAG: phosphoribosylformylglycinamidine synthase I [Planctomycetota bacterium]
MPTPRVLILRAPGTNCDYETAYAFEKAGGRTEFVHINRLLEKPELSRDFQVFCLPGGFSYGDDIAGGRILANQIRHHLYETMSEFKAAEKLILGICNGFQVLLKSGILLGNDQALGVPATLTWSDAGRFEDRWVHLAVQQGSSVFLQNIQRMYLPVAHAEGKFVVGNTELLKQPAARDRFVLRYCREQGEICDQLLPFPINPNGSMANVAGACDETGRVLGLMPHPERHIEQTQHPRWTRGQGQSLGDGLAVFQNAVQYFA